MTKKPVRVVVTGAAGQIAYALIFRIASGEMLGSDQPIILRLLEIPAALDALQGVAMEVEDCAYPLLRSVEITTDPKIAFRDADYALLVGATPRGPGMERNDLLKVNAEIFKIQGKALNDYASRHVKVLVVGNPANTNAYIAMRFAPELTPRQFTSMMRLDHNRAIAQLAYKVGAETTAVKKMIVWGNHSATQSPDLSQAVVNKTPAKSLVEKEWIVNEFIPAIQQRGAAVIKARGKSSAASAAYAALMHIRDWVHGTPADDWTSMGIPSDGSYGIPEGLIYSFPVVIQNGDYQIAQGLSLDEFSLQRMIATQQELEWERDAIIELLR